MHCLHDDKNILSGPSDAPPVIAMEYQNQLVFTVPVASRWEGPWPLGVGCALPAWMGKWHKASAMCMYMAHT